MKRFLSLVTALIIAAGPISVMAGESPTPKKNGGGYNGCATSNIALAAKGCQAYINGQIVTSLGDGTIMTSAGNVYDANGKFLYNINGAKGGTAAAGTKTAGTAGGTTTTIVASATEFRFTRAANDADTFKHFTGVKVDGVLVDPKNYDARSGSVIVTLKQSFINTLSEGEHTITAMFDDSEELSQKFTVTKKTTSVPNTSDRDSTPYMVMMGGALVIMAGAGIILARNK